MLPRGNTSPATMIRNQHAFVPFHRLAQTHTKNKCCYLLGFILLTVGKSYQQQMRQRSTGRYGTLKIDVFKRSNAMTSPTA